MKWEMKKLAEVCDPASSNVVQKNLLNDNGDYPIFGASGLIKKVSFYHYDKPYISIVKDGSVGRITKMNAYTSVIGTLQYILPKENINLDYLYYFLLSVDFKKYISGAVIPHIYFRDYKNLDIPLPPLKTQKEIVSKLSKNFSLIDKMRANVLCARTQLQSFFENYLYHIFCHADDWEMKKLGEVCEINPPRDEARKKLKINDLVSFLPMQDLEVFNFYIKTKQEKQLKDVIKSYTYFTNGDVLLAKITPCFENGKMGIAYNLKNGIGFGSSEYFIFRPKETIISEYVYYFLLRSQVREEGKNNMMGAVGHKRLSKNWIENLALPLPPLETQKKIVSRLDFVSARLRSLQSVYARKLSCFESLRQSLLAEVFGEK